MFLIGVHLRGFTYSNSVCFFFWLWKVRHYLWHIEKASFQGGVIKERKTERRDRGRVECHSEVQAKLFTQLGHFELSLGVVS